MARKSKKSAMQMELVTDENLSMEQEQEQEQKQVQEETTSNDAKVPVMESKMSMDNVSAEEQNQPLRIAPVPHGSVSDNVDNDYDIDAPVMEANEHTDEDVKSHVNESVQNRVKGADEFDDTPVVIAAPPAEAKEPEDDFFDGVKKKTVTSGRKRASEKKLRISKPRVSRLSVKGIKQEKEDDTHDEHEDDRDDIEAQDDAYLITHKHLLDDEAGYDDDYADDYGDGGDSDLDKDDDTGKDGDGGEVSTDMPDEPDMDDDLPEYIDDTASDTDDRYGEPIEPDDGYDDVDEEPYGDDDYCDECPDDDVEDDLRKGEFPLCECFPLENVPFIVRSRSAMQFVMPSKGNEPIRFEKAITGRTADKRRINEMHERCITDMPYFEFDGHVIGWDMCNITKDGCCVQKHIHHVFTTRGVYEFLTMGVMDNCTACDLNARFNDILNRVPMFNVCFTPVEDMPEYTDSVDVEQVSVPCCGVLEIDGMMFGMNSQFELDFGSVLKALCDILNDVCACNCNRRSADPEKASFFTAYFYVLDV